MGVTHFLEQTARKKKRAGSGRRVTKGSIGGGNENGRKGIRTQGRDEGQMSNEGEGVLKKANGVSTGASFGRCACEARRTQNWGVSKLTRESREW